MNRLAMIHLVAAAAATGCDLPDPDAEPSEKTRASWVLTLKVDGAEVKLLLESLDVYLVEDETESEIFEMTGPSVALVGEFPTSIHVGYEGKWERLFGKAIPIRPHGGDPRDPRDSQITLPGKGPWKIVEGSFTAKTSSGKFANAITLSGTVKLLVRTDTGDGFTVEGTFSVHAQTWG